MPVQTFMLKKNQKSKKKSISNHRGSYLPVITESSGKSLSSVFSEAVNRAKKHKKKIYVVGEINSFGETEGITMTYDRGELRRKFAKTDKEIEEQKDRGANRFWSGICQLARTTIKELKN